MKYTPKRLLTLAVAVSVSFLATNQAEAGDSLVTPQGPLVKGPVSLVKPVSLGGSSSLVQTQTSLVHPGGPLVFPQGPLVHPVKLLGDGVSLLTQGKCNHHLMVGTDTLFAFDKSDLTPAAQATLTKLSEVIKTYGKHPLSIEGHTDGKGTDQYNQPLSERRANAVKTWLIAHGAVPRETPAVGFGKTRPIAPNTHPDGSDNPAGRQQNRRVEVVVDTCH